MAPVRENDGWEAFSCTAPEAAVQQIPEAFADRAAIAQDVPARKGVDGAGQQQVRHYWANIAVFHRNLWLPTLIELGAWDQSPTKRCDRTASPWGDADRRPSHADRRNALRRWCIQHDMPSGRRRQRLARKFRGLVARLIKLVA